MKRADLTGKTFGRLLVVGLSFCNGHSYWDCKCDCGNNLVVNQSYLISGDTKSCGCLQKELLSQRTKKHGMRHTLFYHIWLSMNNRCRNVNDKDYKDYGGRGIKVEWNNFEQFMADMYNDYLKHIEHFGQRNTCIDRTHNDGNYSKENCRWVTHKINARNSRHARLITYKGDTKCITEWAEIFNLNKDTLRHRFDAGWAIEKALHCKIQGYRQVGEGK